MPKSVGADFEGKIPQSLLSESELTRSKPPVFFPDWPVRWLQSCGGLTHPVIGRWHGLLPADGSAPQTDPCNDQQNSKVSVTDGIVLEAVSLMNNYSRVKERPKTHSVRLSLTLAVLPPRT